MPDGDFRRPPLLWEQKLAQLVSMTSVGVVSGGGTDPNMPDPPPGDGGPGVEPEPVLPAPVDFIAPSTPTLSGTVQGLRVSWDGLNSAGNRYPSDVYVEVHYATSGATFTPSSSTLAGTLLGSAGFFTIMGLTAGTTYYVRLVGVDAKGNRTAASTAASSQTGLTTSSDYGTATIGSGAVSFNARQIGGITTTVGTTQPSSPVAGDIWLDSSSGTSIIHKRWNGSTWVTQAWGSDSLSANCITSVQLAAGSIAAGSAVIGDAAIRNAQIASISADKITAGIISADRIDTNTLTGKTLRTAASGRRVEITASGTNNGQIEFYNSSNVRKGFMEGDASYVSIGAPDGLGIRGNIFGGRKIGSEFANPDAFIYWSGGVDLGLSPAVNSALRISLAGAVFSYGIDEATTANAANVRVGASAQLLKSTSTVRLKDELTPLTDDLEGVPADKLADFDPSVDPYDVLSLTPTEFRSLSPADADARSLGFIAEDVAAKFPWAANWDDEGLPSAVEDRPILAALVYVVREQQQQITDLTARIEALEA